MDDVIETASSGRSKCRGCQQKIQKGELRYGEAVPNPFGSGEALHWYHLSCGAERRSESFLGALRAHMEELPEKAELERRAVGQAQIVSNQRRYKNVFCALTFAAGGASVVVVVVVVVVVL